MHFQKETAIFCDRIEKLYIVIVVGFGVLQ